MNMIRSLESLPVLEFVGEFKRNISRSRQPANTSRLLGGQVSVLHVIVVTQSNLIGTLLLMSARPSCVLPYALPLTSSTAGEAKLVKLEVQVACVLLTQLQ